MPTLYLVNSGRRHVGYAWQPPSASAADQASEALVCGTPHWAGRGHNYLWLDLNAGPLEWGPVTSGEGIVSGHAIPFIEDEAAFRDPRTRQSFLTLVGGYVVHTAQRLISTAPTRLPVAGLPVSSAGAGQAPPSLLFVLMSDTAQGEIAVEHIRQL
jgi:hypothetical protein